MKINADLTKRALLLPSQRSWVPSPEPGVERVMLDRDGDEVARATSLVRFAKGSSFAPHVHELGEELLVLEGVFSDEEGDYPAGTYLRNPPGSVHRPHSAPGCLLFVKLRQFDLRDQERKTINTRALQWQPASEEGVSRALLHQFGAEAIWIIQMQPHSKISRHTHHAGEELFVLEGSISDEQGHYPTGSWLRNPAGSEHQLYSQEGALLFVKSGHLPPNRPAAHL